MVWLIGHSQPKGPAAAMLKPSATAPQLDSTNARAIDGGTLRSVPSRET